jgi:uroporphyrin-III C-methyltransferase/precorrin-2 dehydrogenase/sirohydrochlorin ferrochelatase
MTSPDYPLFLDLRDKRVLVVGGGPLAQRRTEALLAAGARVTLVSPWATEDLRVAAAGGGIVWNEREFAPGDVAGAWLVHACTGDAAVDNAAVAAAEAARVWSVRASDAAASPAWAAATAATVDGVQFAVNGGRDPRRATALRDTIADLAADGALPIRRRRLTAGRVHLVGAGPGDPDLMTVRARRLLSLADVVVTDRLAPVAVLEGVGDDVEIVDVGKAPGRHAMAQEQINDLLVDRARQGKVVVRLKGGDPFVLGRGGEEALHCIAAGIDVDVVPGVTSAFSVPAAAGIPVTHRGLSDAVTVLSAHSGPDEVIRRAGCTPADTTLILLMGVRHLPRTAEELIAAGRPADTPAAVIASGWTRDQQSVSGTLADIAERAMTEQIGPPAVIVIGAVANLHDRMAGLGRISVDAGHGAIA